MKTLTKILLACVLLFSGVVLAQKEFTRVYYEISYMTTKSVDPISSKKKSIITFNYGDDYYIRIQSLGKDIVLTILGEPNMRQDDKGNKYQEVQLRDSDKTYHTLRLFTDRSLGVMFISHNPLTILHFF